MIDDNINKAANLNEITQKLNIIDYTFEIDGKDIYNCELKYYIVENRLACYSDGHVEEIYNPVIGFEICGFDNDKNEAWISFEINIGLEELNKYSSNPVSIIDKVSMSEAFMKKPNDENSTFLDFEIPKNTIDDMYVNLSNIWVYKIEKNIFMFKICVPSERIFSYFKIDFSKK